MDDEARDRVGPARCRIFAIPRYSDSFASSARVLLVVRCCVLHSLIRSLALAACSTTTTTIATLMLRNCLTRIRPVAAALSRAYGTASGKVCFSCALPRACAC